MPIEMPKLQRHVEALLVQDLFLLLSFCNGMLVPLVSSILILLE